MPSVWPFGTNHTDNFTTVASLTSANLGTLHEHLVTCRKDALSAWGPLSVQGDSLPTLLARGAQTLAK